MRWRSAVPLLVALLALSEPLPAATATATVGLSDQAVDAGYTNDVLLPDWQVFRRALGYPDDEDAIHVLLGDPATNFEFGAPLSGAEAEDLVRRMDIQEASMALAQYVSSKESAFGGFHFEHVPAFTLVIQVAGSASASDVREAVSLIPGGSRVPR